MANNLSSDGRSFRQGTAALTDHKLEESEEVSFKQVLHVLRKRYRIVILAMLLGGTGALLLSSMQKPYFASTVTLEIGRDTSNPLNASGIGALAESLGGGDDVKTQLATEVTVLQNSKLLDEVMEHLNYVGRYPIRPRWYSGRRLKEVLRQESLLPLAKAPTTRAILEAIFTHNLKVQSVPDTRLLTVEFDDQDPEYAAQVANYLVTRYVEDHFDRRNSNATDATRWMSVQLESLHGDVDASQQKLRDYEKQSGLVAVPSADLTQGNSPQFQDIRLQRLVAINQQYVQAKANRVVKEATYRICETKNPDTIASMLGSGMSGSQNLSQQAIFSGLMALRSQESSVKVQVASVMNTYGPNNPHLAGLNLQLEELHRQESGEIDRILRQIKSDYTLAVESENSMKLTLDNAMREAGEANDSQIHLAILQQEAQSASILYQDLYTKLKEAQLSAATRNSNVEVISPAVATSAPVHPKVPLDTIMGVGGGLLLGLLTVFLLENLDDTIATSLQVEEITGSAVLGNVPDFATTRDQNEENKGFVERGRWLLDAPKSSISESYRDIRSAILLSQADEPPKTIMVTSCLPKEGKSTTVFNISCSLALTGKRVLVVDADLRKPTLHVHAQLPNQMGLSTELTSSGNLNSSIVQVVGTESLFALTSGPIPPNPSELLGSQRFRDLLDQLKVRFDFVIIDVPPMVSVTDATMIAPYVDGVIVVVRASQTTKVLLRRLSLMIARLNCNLLGYVLNGVDMRSADYYYYNGHYSTEAYYGESNEK